MVTDLLLLEDVCVFAQAQFAKELREVRAFERAVQVTAIASCQRRNAVHVIATAEIVLRWKARERQASSVNAQRQHGLIKNFNPSNIFYLIVGRNRAVAAEIQQFFTETLAFH